MFVDFWDLGRVEANSPKHKSKPLPKMKNYLSIALVVITDRKAGRVCNLSGLEKCTFKLCVAMLTQWTFRFIFRSNPRTSSKEPVKIYRVSGKNCLKKRLLPHRTSFLSRKKIFAPFLSWKKSFRPLVFLRNPLAPIYAESNIHIHVNIWSLFPFAFLFQK